MAGERTPDTSPGSNTSGQSTDNDISLREHMQRQIESMQHHYAVLLNERQNILDVRMNDQRAYFERILEEHRLQLNERYETQTKALDAAFAAAERAVAAALLAAERAVLKAESAADKRFESVNEFRGQLADQTNTFMPRSEADVRITSLADRVDQNNKKLNEMELRLQSRLDVNLGRTAGVDKAWGYLVGAIGLAGGIIAILLAFN